MNSTHTKTVAVARASGFAVAVKGLFGWQAFCPTCRWHSTAASYKGEASLAARAHNDAHHAKPLSRCTRCSLPMTRANTTLQPDERALGMTLADVDVCNGCRDIVDENYGLACSFASMRGAA